MRLLLIALFAAALLGVLAPSLPAAVLLGAPAPSLPADEGAAPEADGTAYVLGDLDGARRCALMEAWSRLLGAKGADRGVISNRHPAFAELAWALASETVRETPGADTRGKTVTVRLRAPGGDRTAFEAPVVKSVEADIDLDGVAESCALLLDGTVCVRKGPAELARTPSLSFLSFHGRPDGWREVTCRLPSGISWDGVSKLLIETVTERCAGYCYLGGTRERWGVDLTGLTAASWRAPTIEIASPADFSTAPEARVALRASVSDPEAVRSLSVKCNGGAVRELKPGGRRTTALREEIPLEPGDNVIEIAAENYPGNLAVREAAVTAPPLDEKSAAASFDAGRRRIVLVGIDRYWDNRIGAARGCARDARRLSALFRRPSQGGVSSDMVTALTDDAARRERFFQMLGGLPAPSGAFDSLVFYFAGRGILIPGADGPAPGELGELTARTAAKPLLPQMRRPSPAILFSDSRLDALAYTALPVRELVRLARPMARKVLVILDCPFPDPEGTARSDLPSDMEEPDDLTGVTVIEATRPGGSRRDRGDFARHLVDGLDGKADDPQDGYVDSEELYRYVFGREVERARRTGDAGSLPLRLGKPYGLLPLSRAARAAR